LRLAAGKTLPNRVAKIIDDCIKKKQFSVFENCQIKRSLIDWPGGERKRWYRPRLLNDVLKLRVSRNESGQHQAEGHGAPRGLPAKPDPNLVRIVELQLLDKRLNLKRRNYGQETYKSTQKWDTPTT
jgi:hypothetical protein